MSDHKGNAQNWLEMADHHGDWAGGAPKQTVERYLAAAQAEATLYLAEQQRIANLIALWTANESDTEMLMRAGVNFGGVLDQIREGLGLA